MNRKPGQMSGDNGSGLRLVVPWCRAQVYLLDEPLSNWMSLRERVRADIKQPFAAQSPCRLCYPRPDRSDDALYQSGCGTTATSSLDPPERIYNHPRRINVAGFVGSPQMNLLTLPDVTMLGEFALPEVS